MDSRVLIHYVHSDGKVWAEYLNEKLRSKDIAIHCESIVFSDNSVCKGQVASLLNVFFVTPDFLELQTWNWANSVDKNKCILVLTGTENEDLEFSAQQNKFDSVTDFFIYQLEGTEESVRDLLVFIIAKYEEIDHNRHERFPPPDPHRHGSLPTPDSQPYGNISISEQYRRGSLPPPGPHRQNSSTTHYSREKEHLHHTESEPRAFKYQSPSRSISEQNTSRGSSVSSYSPSLSSVFIQEDTMDSDYDVLPKRQRQVNKVQDAIYKDGHLYMFLLRRAEGALKIRLKDAEITPVFQEWAVYKIPYEGKQSENMSVMHDGTSIGETIIQIPDSTKPGSTVITCTQQHPTAETQTDDCVPTSCVSVGTQTDDSEIVEGRSKSSKDNEDESPSRESIYVNIDDVERELSSSGELSEEIRKNKLEYIRKLLEDETNPEEILCQCLGIDKSVRHLDEKMTSLVKSVETLRHLSFSGSRTVPEDKESAVWPTLVHFGAQFNLVRFCEVLLCNPLMYGACVQKNKDGHLPYEIAQNHGHHELADMLKHFSEFVRAEKERDSGIYGISPRLSAISTLTSASDAPPPSPHRPSHFGEGYVNMHNKDHDKLNKPREMSSISKDGGFRGSSGSDGEYIPMSPISPLTQALFKNNFWDTPHASSSSELSSDTLHDSSEIDAESGTLHGSDMESDPDYEHHRKDVSNLLGITQQFSPTEEGKHKKPSKLRKLLFGGKKNRSNSEPSIFTGDILTRHEGGKIKQRDSTRSSSSTASTYSDEEVTMRGDKKQASKKKMKGFLKTAKKRQSMRIKKVLDDNEIRAPALPSKTSAEMF